MAKKKNNFVSLDESNDTAMDLSNSKYKDDDAPEKNSDTEENEGPH